MVSQPPQPWRGPGLGRPTSMATNSRLMSRQRSTGVGLKRPTTEAIEFHGQTLQDDGS
jgi:hypothetical protein